MFTQAHGYSHLIWLGWIPFFFSLLVLPSSQGKDLIGVDYPVSRVSFSFAQPLDGLPDLSELADATLELDCSENPILLFDLIRGASPVLSMGHKDIFKISEVVLHFMKSYGYEGVVVFPDPRQINPVTGEDLRIRGSSELTFLVWVSVLKSVRLETDGLKKNEKEILQTWMDRHLEKFDSIDQPVRAEFFEHLRKWGTHPSRNFKIVLGATEEPGKVDAVIQATRRKRDHFSLSLANAGTESTGEWLFSSNFQTDQLTGLDDGLTVGMSVSNSGERRAVGGAYYIPLIRPGLLVMGVGAGYSSYDASTFAVQNIDFEGDNLYLDTSLKIQPGSWKGEKYSGGFEIGLKLENVTAFNSLFVNSADTTLLTPRIQIKFQSKVKYRLAETRIGSYGNMLEIDEDSLTALGGVDANDRYGRIEFGHSEFWRLGKLFMEMSDSRPGEYAQRHLLSFRMKVDWALDSGRHLPQHQFITGGTGSVRGYPESPAAGDHGYFASVEYRFPFLLLDGPSDAGKLAWSLIPFVDFAQTFVNDPFFFEADQTLVGAGLGFEFELPYGMLARVDFAKPLSELKSAGRVLDGTKSGDYRVHGLFRWNF